LAAKVVTLKAPELTLGQRLYIPEILKGMVRTAGHLFRNLIPTFRDELRARPWRRGGDPTKFSSIPTIAYPEAKRGYSGRMRGRHILKEREDHTLKCVACYMCQKACPADCIDIEAGEHPVLAYEKYPVKFEIDLLRCVYCGYCVDACPKDAIWMTRDYELSFFDRTSAVVGIPELREKPDDTAPGGPGYGYRPYYGESPMKKAGEFEPSGIPLLPVLEKRGKVISAPPPPPPPKPAAAAPAAPPK
jgi:NADH-quinone oxidoreductase subunit I